jgi:hypothetical protein
MNALRRFAVKLHSRAAEHWYLLRERRLAAAGGNQRPLSILVARRDEWEASIRRGFAGLPHRLTFDAIASADLDRHDLIVPLSLDDAHFLRQQAAHVRERALPLPDEDCTALCHDKPRLNRFLIDAGFAAHVPPMGEHLAPPYICKPARGENSVDCLLVPDGATEARLGHTLCQPDRFRQVAVPGPIEYATHFLVRHGLVVRELTVAFHHRTPLYVKDGNATDVVRVLGACPDIGTLRGMLRTVGYEGMGCANYKFEQGRLQLIEINPRMGGSLGGYLFSFLRSLPQISRTRERGCTNWTWLDSLAERDSSAFGA